MYKSTVVHGRTSEYANAGLLEIQQRQMLYYQQHCQFTESLRELGFVYRSNDPYTYSVEIPSEVPLELKGKFYTATATKDVDGDGIWDTWEISGLKDDPVCTVYDKED